MNLSDVNQGIQKFKPRTRVGRGPGSGHGKTAARGHKGNKSRAGWSRKPTFQGGMLPLVRRVPKRGFNNKWAKIVATINVRDLARFETGTDVTPDLVREKLVGHRFDELKILGDGDLKHGLKVHAHRFSATAEEKIKAAGGDVVRVATPTPVEEKKAASKA